MILFKAEAILASSISKFGKSLPLIERDDVKSSTESTISTSLIRNIASEGKSEHELTRVWNLIFQHGNVEGVGIISNWSSEICSLCWSAKEFCGISAGSEEFMVDGLPVNIGIGIVLPIRSSLLTTGLLYFSALGFHLFHFHSLSEEFLDKTAVMNRACDVDCQQRFPVSPLLGVVTSCGLCARVSRVLRDVLTTGCTHVQLRILTQRTGSLRT